MRCPICNKTFAAAESTALPFCSERCRTIDLGRWLGESYGMPIEPQDAVDPSIDDQTHTADRPGQSS
jgi:endogenous inhibitor of DNA gyrase (YacG/DUF329 family)